MIKPTEQITQLKTSMKALEAQRAVLGDQSVDAALVGLRLKLAELEQGRLPQERLPAESPPVPQTEGERRDHCLF